MTTTRKPKNGKCPFKPPFKVEDGMNGTYILDTGTTIFCLDTLKKAKWICAALNAYAARDQKSK